MPTFTFTVTVEVERISGKFAANDDIAAAIQEELEQAAQNADVSGHDVDGNSEYEVVDASVEQEETPRVRRPKRKPIAVTAAPVHICGACLGAGCAACHGTGKLQVIV